MAKFVERIIPGRGADAATPADAATGAARVANYVGSGSGDDSTVRAAREPRSVAGDDASSVARESGDYAKVGEHVASVLEAARSAAAKIRQEARDDARDVVERARKLADETVAEAHREASEANAAAERTRAESEAAAAQVRERADHDAADVRSAAQKEGAEIVARAEADARERTLEAHTRMVNLGKSISRAEERVVQLVAGLRDTASRLESVITLEDVPAGAVTGGALAEPLDESLRTAAVKRTRDTQAPEEPLAP